MAIADAFDAIFRGRLYRPARSLDESVSELQRHSGSQFDPGLVPLFIDEIDRVESGVPPSGGTASPATATSAAKPKPAAPAPAKKKK